VPTSAPIAASPPEAVLARAALRFGAVAGLPGTGLAWALGGTSAALTTAGMLAFLVGAHALTAAAAAWASRLDDLAPGVVMVTGFFTRLMLLAVALNVLRPLDIVHSTALAVSGAVGVLALLAYEVFVASRHPELWWLRERTENG
jgi:hypothetical protein